MGRISSRELTEWQAYFRLEAEDRRRAELASRARQGVATRKQRRRR